MIKPCFTAFIIIFTIQWSYGQDIEKNLQVSVSAGRQEEDFHWSIAGNLSGQNPNVLSELKWKDVTGTNFNASIQWNVWRRFSVYADYNRVNVHSGNINDADYAGDNRTEPTYNENFADNKGYTTAWNAGAGYIIFNNSLFSLTPYFGYTKSSQLFYITDNSGQFSGLNSSYEAWWKGAFLKVRSSLKIWSNLKAMVDVTYSQVSYSANGDWNLISQFQHPLSYSHSAKGYGINAGAKLVYNINRYIGLNVGYNYFNWQTGNGTDQLYLVTHEIDKTQLNGVYRNGYTFNVGVVFSL